MYTFFIPAFIAYWIIRRGKPKSTEKGIDQEEVKARLALDFKDMVKAGAIGLAFHFGIWLLLYILGS